MNHYLVEFLQEQSKEIEIYKWVESEKANKDLGLEAELDWVKKNAKEFRRKYIKKESAKIMKKAQEEIEELEDLAEISISELVEYHKKYYKDNGTPK